MTLADRIRLIRRQMGLSQTGLAMKVGVARSAVAQWERKGGARPTMENMIKLAVIGSVGHEWLATGRGRMLLEGDDNALVLEIDLNLYAQDELEKRLLTAFREIRYPGNQGLVELIETLIQRDRESGNTAFIY